jgi:hypothetical protein
MKKVMKYVFTILFIAGMTMACNQAKNSSDVYKNSREIFDQAIEIHDKVMPKMGKIMQLKKSLNETKDQLTDENIKIEVDSAVNNLEMAYNRMMKWMRNIPKIPEYNPNENSGEAMEGSSPDPGELEKSQRQSLEEIKKVQEDVDKSIEEAEKLLESLPGT